MSLSLVIAATATVAAEAEGEGGPAIPVVVVGLIAFAILMSLLIGLLAFAGGRDHS